MGSTFSSVEVVVLLSLEPEFSPLLSEELPEFSLEEETVSVVLVCALASGSGEDEEADALLEV